MPFIYFLALYGGLFLGFHSGREASEQFELEKIYLFSQIQNPGINPPPSENKVSGGPQRYFFAYIQYSGKQGIPRWKTVFLHHFQYRVETLPIHQDSIFMGILKEGQKPYSLIFKKGSQTEEIRLLDPVAVVENSYFTLIGDLKGKTVKIISKTKVIELKDQNFQ